MMITAHSGCDGTPDNSLAYVRFALSLSPDALEVDVHRRADGALVISHDGDDAARYENCPTLAEVLALLREQPAVGINCDCKDAGLEAQILALHEQDAPQNPLLLSGTVSPETLRSTPALLARATILLNAEEIVPDFYALLQSAPDGDVRAAAIAARACKACGATVVNVHYPACTETFQSTLAAQGIGVSVWTVNDLAEARAFAGRQVFNITTRSAQALLAQLRG